LSQSKGSKKTGSSTARKKTSAAGSRSGVKKSGAKNSTGRTGAEKQGHEKSNFGFEIETGLVLLLCVLLFISCLGLAGKAGKVIGAFLYGMFGLLALILPVLVFYLFVFISVNRGVRGVTKRTVSLTGLYVTLCIFVHLLFYGYQEGAKAAELYRASSVSHAGGGLVGGMLAQLFAYAFGTTGAYILVITMIIIFALILFQRPILALVQKKGSEAYETRNDRILAREEKRRDRMRRRDTARARREREQMIRDKQRVRSEKAREQSAAARRVDPQTITASTGRVTPYPAKEISPITAPPEIRRGPVDRRVNTGDKVSPIPSLSAEDIPDDIIENGRSEMPAAGAQNHREQPDGRAVGRDGTGAPATAGKGVKDRTDAAGKNAAASSVKTGSAAEDDDLDSMAAAVGSTGMNTAAAGSKADRNKATGKDGKPDAIVVPEQEEKPYTPPPVTLLDKPSGNQVGESNEYLKQMGAKLQQTLQTFGVEVRINHISCGPSVTRFELTPKMGVKVSRILSLHDDIKLALAAEDIRIEAPIPGKSAVGIEVPNKKKTMVNFRELISSDAFRSHKSPLAFAVGRNIAGQPVVADLAKMPHLLIAGATGSGKSVFINTLIMSLIYKSAPDEVKFIMIDPKVVELSVYNGIPQLLIPVVTDPKKAAGALNWAVQEMTSRYQKFAETGSRDLKSYNAHIKQMDVPEGQKRPKKMYRIVVIVDELADLMMVAQNDVEESICRLAQLARAAGIHLVIATQRPSVDVITGLIKANMPSRVALSVTSGVDSRTIIDMNGAEKLLGNGDMLFYPQGYQKPARIQGAFLSDDEIGRVTDFLKKENSASDEDGQKAIQDEINSHTLSAGGGDGGEQDEYFAEAGRLIIEKDKASIGMLQRAFRIGFNRAARIMDQLCDAGVVGEEEGTKPRRILMSMEQFENYLEGSE